MVELLHPVEVRVLGSLIEKEIATPEYYPLTLNALVAACNQKTNREPVVSYDEDAVSDALESLRRKKLVATVTGAGIRVPKHRELLAEVLNLGRRELALICVLMLRGHQTVGELRDRAERLHAFSDLAEVESCLERLMEAPEPLVTKLPRQPGMKEPRYAHLLSGPVQAEEPASAPPIEVHSTADRVSALEAQVAALGEELEALKREFAGFRRQFE